VGKGKDTFSGGTKIHSRQTFKKDPNKGIE